MNLDPKIILILVIFFFNLVYFVNNKSRIAACLNVTVVVLLLILLLSLTATNQTLFKNVSLLLLIFLAICVFVIIKQDEVKKLKKDVKKNSFSIGYFLLVSLAVIGVFISVSFLLTFDPNIVREENKIEAIKKVDVNNVQLAKKKYDSKTSLFKERDLAIKMFKGLSDLVLFVCCLISVILPLTMQRDKMNL